MTETTDNPYLFARQYIALQIPDMPTPTEVFDFQVRTIKNKGLDLPNNDIDRLRSLIPSERQLFVVIPRRPTTLDLKGLMALIEVDGEKGQNFMDSKDLPAEETPAEAHLLLDVEDGRGRRDETSIVSIENIRQEERLPYTIWYGLVHGILFPHVLLEHNLELCGSLYDEGCVPILTQNKGGVGRDAPTLFHTWYSNSGHGGAPSARSVVGA